jgi:hypothetical protein
MVAQKDKTRLIYKNICYPYNTERVSEYLRLTSLDQSRGKLVMVSIPVEWCIDAADEIDNLKKRIVELETLLIDKDNNEKHES